MAYRRILLTTDGSELSRAAVPHALQLATGMGAELLVVEVIDSVDQVLARTSPAYGSGTHVTQEILVREAEEAAAIERAEAARFLAELRAQLEAGGAEHVECQVVEGNPAPTIILTAEASGCDIITMATHGRSGLRRAVLGSVADYVVRHAPCPVLLVRPS